MNEKVNYPLLQNEVPIVITRGAITFPDTVKTIYVQRSFSVKSYEMAISNFESLCVIASQKDMNKENVESLDDIYDVATFCKIVSSSGDPASSIRVRFSVIDRVKITSLDLSKDYFTCKAEVMPDVFGDKIEEEALVKRLVNTLNNNDSNVYKVFTEDYRNLINRGINALELSYLISDVINADTKTKYELLAASTVNDRLKKLLEEADKIYQSNKIDKQLEDSIRESAQKAQKEYFLREKMRAIQKELGEDENTRDKILDDIEKNPYPQEVKEKIKNEYKRMANMPQGSIESSLIKDYIDIVMDVPWFQETTDNEDIKNVQKVLDEDHYGLKKVKERIIEYLAVKAVNKDLKAPILCFYGPPGCGKTSLAASIARALGKKFIKCSLGGVSDEAEIRGHRRTYVGSRPGRIINSLRKAKTVNPVFLLDEVDKLGSSYKGDPSSALLEVLDPEQNFAFYDNYLELSYDLSKVLFICTANDLGGIPAPLMDRLELVEVDSYTLIDKIHIAQDYLIPKELKNNGLKPEQVEFTDEGISYVIERYTRESGVRTLERRIATILRKIVVDLLKGKINDKVIVKEKEVKKYLGIEDFDPTNKEKGKQIGVVTGLAWTPFGGDILPIEVNYFPGKGRLVLTGKLGDVMKESCEIALDYIRANADKFGIDSKLFQENDIHIHVPEGAVSKDGPSAGCAITTAMVSAFTKTPVSGDIAMTGEVTLRGNALPIGGLREKTLAALRRGIKTVIVPKDNKKTVTELPKEIKDNLNIVYMSSVDEAIKICLGR